MLHQAAAESHERRAGSAAVLERVAEMVFVDAARRYLESLPADASGWLAALRDRHVGRAIALMHERDATVATVAQEVGYGSEAAFARAFKRLVGQPPAAWRRAQRVAG